MKTKLSCESSFKIVVVVMMVIVIDSGGDSGDCDSGDYHFSTSVTRRLDLQTAFDNMYIDILHYYECI